MIIASTLGTIAFWLWGVFVVLFAVGYVLNVGQLVHGSSDPNFWERLGRRQQ